MCFSQQTLEHVEQLIEKKNFKTAQTTVQDYLETHPDDLKAVELLGDTYGHQKKWDAAIAVYEKLVNAKPNVANYHYKYGGVLGMKALENKFKAIGLIGDIKSAFIKATELDKNHIDARWALVELYMQLPAIFGGSKSNSLKYAKELEALSRVDGYLAIGYIHDNVQLEKGEKCLQIYLNNYSAKDGVPKAWAHYRLAQIHTHKQNKSQALAYIDLALKELPKIKPFKAQKEKILQL